MAFFGDSEFSSNINALDNVMEIMERMQLDSNNNTCNDDFKPIPGYVLVTRNKKNKKIMVVTVEDWREYMDEDDEPRKLIFCQAVSNIEAVDHDLDEYLEGFNIDPSESATNVVARFVTDVQCMCNEYPLESFRNVKLDVA